MEDIAGNSVVGNQENQAFIIDTVAPILKVQYYLEDDTGEIKEEYFTDKENVDNIITFSVETELDEITLTAGSSYAVLPNLVSDSTLNFVRVESIGENIWAPSTENPQIFTISSTALNTPVSLKVKVTIWRHKQLEID